MINDGQSEAARALDLSLTADQAAELYPMKVLLTPQKHQEAFHVGR